MVCFFKRRIKLEHVHADAIRQKSFGNLFDQYDSMATIETQIG